MSSVKIAALTTNLCRLNARLHQLAQGQEFDNIAHECGRLTRREFMRRWGERQREILSIENRAFWLRNEIEELQKGQMK